MGLAQQWSQVLLELRMLASGPLKAQKLDGRTTGSRDHAPVSGECYPDVGYWERRWLRQSSRAGQEGVLAAAREEVMRLKVSPAKKGKYVVNTLEYKGAIANEPGDAAKVARLYGVGVSTVYKYRKLYKVKS